MIETLLKIVEFCSLYYQPSLLPVIFVVLCTTGLLTSYLLAAFLQHDVSPIFPRISHTGNFPPASMIFSFTLGMAAILLILISHVTFSAMKTYANSVYQQNIESLQRINSLADSSALKEFKLQYIRNLKFNQLSLCCGVLTGVGALGVGTFQVTYSKVLHYLPLVLMVIAGYSYSILHTINSRAFLDGIMQLSQRSYLFKLRVTVTIAGAISLFGMFVFTIIGRIKWEPSVSCSKEEIVLWQAFKNCSKRNHNWRNGDGGFVYFAISNVGQWLWLASFFVFVFTIRNELNSHAHQERKEKQEGSSSCQLNETDFYLEQSVNVTTIN